jgi:hypothetical protein
MDWLDKFYQKENEKLKETIENNGRINRCTDEWTGSDMYHNTQSEWGDYTVWK